MILSELASRLGCDLRGQGDVNVVRVSGLEYAGPGDLSFVANHRYVGLLAKTRASAVIVSPELDTPLPSLLSPNPYLAYARAATLLHPQERPAPGIHPTAQIDPSAVVGEGAHVGVFAVVGPRARVGARSVLHPHVVVYPDVEIGADCLLHSGVQVREGCRIGDRVVIQNGSVIGGDGFGFARDQSGRYEKIPQVGIVVVEDDVEIGALVAIDRSSMHETRIGRGAKIDNLVQIGHSVTVGADTVLAGQVGVAGSTRIGERVILAGQVGVAGHLTIGDGAVATAQTGIPGSVAPGAVVSGTPACDNRSWLKASAILPRLPDLKRRLRALERQVEALTEAARDGRADGQAGGEGEDV